MALKKSELYGSLWQSCDELRGGMDASQYKDYVLVLLFIKYVSDKFAGQPYAPITIPKGASFQDMVALKGMRHLIDTYIEAAEPRRISPFDNLTLLELIVKTGIAEAIANQLGSLKGNKDAIAETIENNVRKKIIKEQLTDPAFYETMSALLDEIIAARKAKAIEYEEYLKRIAELAKKVETGKAGGHASEARHAGQAKALQQSRPERRTGATDRRGGKESAPPPDGWRGVQAREQVIKATLYSVLQDVAEVERIFLIVKAQAEY